MSDSRQAFDPSTQIIGKYEGSPTTLYRPELSHAKRFINGRPPSTRGSAGLGYRVRERSDHCCIRHCTPAGSRQIRSHQREPWRSLLNKDDELQNIEMTFGGKKFCKPHYRLNR